jgi:hypothetical protein
MSHIVIFFLPHPRSIFGASFNCEIFQIKSLKYYELFQIFSSPQLKHSNNRPEPA